MHHELCCQIIESFLDGHGWIQPPRFNGTSEDGSLISLFDVSADEIGSVGSVKIISHGEGEFVAKVTTLNGDRYDFDNIGDACSLLEDTRAGIENGNRLASQWEMATTNHTGDSFGFRY